MKRPDFNIHIDLIVACYYLVLWLKQIVSDWYGNSLVDLFPDSSDDNPLPDRSILYC